jgi:hypothetical protein
MRILDVLNMSLFCNISKFLYIAISAWKLSEASSSALNTLIEGSCQSGAVEATI